MEDFSANLAKKNIYIYYADGTTYICVISQVHFYGTKFGV